MSTTISYRTSPEDEELHSKRRELASLQEKLIEQELGLANLKGELSDFERLYLKVVGVKYAELDEIEAQIAELRAHRQPNDAAAKQQAEAARARAEETHTSTAQANGRAQFAPSPSLRALYREVAKAIHPDLAENDADRARRQGLMAEANEAYEAGDEVRLRSILQKYRNSPETVLGDDTAAELVRVIRKMAQVKERISEIKSEIERLTHSELMTLKVKVEEARKQGRDLLTEMADAVALRIREAQMTLNALSVR